MSARSHDAAALREALQGPVYNRTLKKEVGRGELEYEVYLRTRDLLSLQTPSHQLVVPDELLFQVQHQTQELWLKIAAFEAATLVQALDAGEPYAAIGALDRIVAVTRSLGEQIRVLFTLSPDTFQVIRRSLGSGSGLESPGYNHVLVAAEAAGGALERALSRRGVALAEVYTPSDRHPDLRRVVERFVDWDAAFQSWLFEHFVLVRRTIGVDRSVRALDGFPTVALASRMTRPLFPDLWDVRVQLTQGWTREGGFSPGEPRDGGEPRPELASAAPAAPTEAATVRPPRAVHSSGPVPRGGPALRALRAEFPLLERCTYLNSNSTGAVPRGARDALEAYWSTLERWRDEAWERFWQDLGSYADAVARLVGAPPGSVVCDGNVATLLGRVLSCFDYRRRPRVVTTDVEFPSMPLLLRGFARYGLEPVVVPAREEGRVDEEALLAAIDERTQLVCVSHATYTTGALTDLAPIVRRAHDVGALVAVDAYQSVGTVPVDVASMDVDFLLGGAHKWLCGSIESAFLYVRPALLPSLVPATTGWVASAEPLAFAPSTQLAKGARRLAAGTPAVLPALVSRVGLDIVASAGVDRIREESLARTEEILGMADEAGLTVLTPRDKARRGGIVALRFPGDAAAVAALKQRGYVCSYRGAVRVAPHFYNTEAEVAAFMTELVAAALAGRVATA